MKWFTLLIIVLLIGAKAHQVAAEDCDARCQAAKQAEEQRIKEWQKRIKSLAPAEEKRWIEAFKSYKTDDGSTILQALDYVQMMRPKEFKYFFDDTVGYNGATGLPDAVGVGFYIGMKRLPGDEFGAGADVKVDGENIELIFRRGDGSQSAALVGGRDTFPHFIDEQYEELCIEGPRRKKIC